MGQTELYCPHCGFDFRFPEAKPSRLSRVAKLFWLALLLALPFVVFHLWWPNFYRDITFRTYQSYLNQTPPELVLDGDWLNTDSPLELQTLRGQVVWLQFGFCRCGGCIAMAPQLIEWQREFSKDGFLVIEVYNGAADKQFFDDPLNVLRKHIADHQVQSPVLFDENGTNCDRYGVQGYPSGYLIDRDGQVVWEDCPHGNQARVEAKIREALRHTN